MWDFEVKHTPVIFIHVQCLCFSMNDNESAAEMLIETFGPAIVNATDSQSRWEQGFLTDQMFPSRADVCVCVCVCVFCRTSLHAAAYTDHVECLQLLLGHNAQVNAIDMLGKTPLMMAAENGQTNAVGETQH